jgi:hypothetical protein
MRRTAAIFLILAATVTLFGCQKETEQDKIKKIIKDIQAAGEQKDVKKIMSHLSITYDDPRGHNHEAIKVLLLGYFFRYPKISAYINNLDISVENTSARAVFQTILTSGKKTGSVTDMIPQSLGIWDFEVTLKKESAGWKVSSARWAQVDMIKSGEAGTHYPAKAGF